MVCKIYTIIGLSRREIYKNKICGIVETNFRFENVFLQVLGSGAYGSPQSLIVQSHYHRFLFNCGEGTRRIALDNKIECDYFTRLFVTSCSWDNVSGLPGFVIRENRVDEIMPRGILSTSKLVSADVPPGPLVDDLRNGLTVTLQDGRIVTPLDVSIHNYKSSSFIVLEIPSVEYLESLISSSDFDKYKKEGTCNDPEENDLKIIVHFSPPEVMKDSRYRQWANSFSPSVSHLVINSRSSCHGLPSPVKMQLQLNHIMPNIFPLFRNPGVPFVNSEEDMLDKEDSLNIPYTSEYQFDGPAVQSKSALQYLFRPFDEFESSNCPVVNPNQFLKDWEEEPILMNSLEELKTVVNNLNLRLMGKDETRSTLRHLKLIFISHIHQDHHFGLSAILTERRKAFLEAGIKSSPPLYILLPPDVFPVLQNIRHCFGLDIQNVVFMDNVKLTGNYNKNFYKYRTLTESLELERVTTAFVHHVRNSFGIALKHIDGWKIVYSGDCRPSKNLVDIGENCDLLIHEATFEDELLDEAEKNGHSTVSQAVKMGRNMNAKFTILTHFSQRYHTLPLLNEKVIKENVGITFDNMEVTFQDLPYLRHMYPTLKEIFYEDFQHSDAQRLRRVYFPDFKKPVFRKS
ncbi:Ribonuclease Z, mitochondrial [Armadillidium vulgare]|nr:Ribonuclease Z, mitochondrial [Armadillidium vulgare]